jgi:hypothetical protein
MDKKIKTRLIIFFLCVLVTYLAIAFIMLKIDFRDWERPIRGCFVMCQIFSVLIALAPYDV